MNITLQHATPGDILQINVLAHRIWREHYPSIVGEQSVEYMLGLFYAPESLQRQMEEGQMFKLIMEDNEALGYLSISNQGEGRYFLHKFYMDKEKRGRGLGIVVFNRLLAHYPDLRELRLTVNRQNYKSINFYFKIGFRIEKCVDIPIGDGYVMDDFQMLWSHSNAV